MAMADKIVKDWNQLAQHIEKLKKQNKKIIFTNGGFNILHVGHIRSLRDAKNRGDVLVVAVNSDASLHLLKGDQYPIIPEDERLEILSALECVDLLTTFSEITVANLLLKIRPHIHAKGTDYTEESVPERETVLSYGGEIAIVGDAKDHSSTSIISRIREWSVWSDKNSAF